MHPFVISTSVLFQFMLYGVYPLYIYIYIYINTYTQTHIMLAHKYTIDHLQLIILPKIITQYYCRVFINTCSCFGKSTIMGCRNFWILLPRRSNILSWSKLLKLFMCQCIILQQTKHIFVQHISRSSIQMTGC